MKPVGEGTHLLNTGAHWDIIKRMTGSKKYDSNKWIQNRKL